VHIKLAYGRSGLEIDLPDSWDITLIEPQYIPGLPDPRGALRQALQQPFASPPLAERVHPGEKVGIIFSDITRPTPHHQILPAVLAELSHLPAQDITLFNALGTHRPNTPAELVEMLGEELIQNYPIIQNNAFDPATQVSLGMSSFGHEIWLNRQVMECDLKVLTGFIEPHFFAGFSGNGKALMPGMAGQRTVLGNHDAGMIGSPHATWGITRGNPIWEEVNEVGRKAGQTFLVNVTLNKHKQITGVFAGDLTLAHAAGCEFVRRTAMVGVDRPFDIVLTTNSGYPLDLNLYQSVKGMSAAAQVVRPGGAIVIAADCWDGIPEHGLYGQMLKDAGSPLVLLERIQAPGFLMQDQWQAQIQAQIQLKAEVYVHSSNLSDEQIRRALLQPAPDLVNTLHSLVETYGPHARLCVLPEGPQTIPYLR
jgi:nickel-dependent lactate racemase